MTQLQQFTRRADTYTYLLLVITNMAFIGVWWVSSQVLEYPAELVMLILLITALVVPFCAIGIINYLYTQPLRMVWQAILYIAPQTTSTPAPEIHKVHYAKDLIVHLTNYIYQLADGGARINSTSKVMADDIVHSFIANNLPLPLVILDKNDSIVFTNTALQTYARATASEMNTKNVHSTIDFSFENEHTLEKWLKHAKKHDITTTQNWERVKLTTYNDDGSNQASLLDLIAYYNKDNELGYETILVLIDRTQLYEQDDQAINFVALAVHELRTPLTMLRGYIEALEEDLRDTLSPELKGFLQKTQASAAQLATFVNNILSVAQLEDDKMSLKIQKEDWKSVLENTIKDLQIRSMVRGITIKTDIADNLPPAGIDRISMYGVISNLVDNAVKYSGDSKEILVSARLNNGLIETSVKDSGVGIPGNVVEHIFEKYYRDHHNRAQIGGTGLGLYLSKNIVKTHGGTIWVHSKEGRGSTFGFTLQPYEKLAQAQKNSDNEGITRNAHGWIKNHSLYRR